MINRSKILERLRNLRERTVENGCTEAEAMAAMGMIGRIMDEHNVAMSEIDVREEALHCETGEFNTGNQSRLPEWAWSSVAISEFTDTKIWREKGKLFFFGLPADVAGALALVNIIKIAVTHESAIWVANNPGRGKAGGNSFRKGMTGRISQRLRELKVKPVATGTALMVLKDQLVTQQFSKLDLNLRHRSTNTGARDRDAYQAGKDAGNRVTLTKTVSGASSQLRLA